MESKKTEQAKKPHLSDWVDLVSNLSDTGLMNEIDEQEHIMEGLVGGLMCGKELLDDEDMIEYFRCFNCIDGVHWEWMNYNILVGELYKRFGEKVRRERE